MSQLFDRPATTAPASPASRERAAPRRRWYLDPLWQLFVAAAGYMVYSVSVGAVHWAGADHARLTAAIQNARQVVDLEKLLGVFHESALQQALAGNGALMQFFNAVYMWAHLPLIIAIAVWLYVRHPGDFRATRNAVLISGAIALVVFQLFPVAPPRLLPGGGFIDTAAKVSGVYDTVEPKVFFNPYAAVPSMHVGWVLLMGLSIWRYAGWRPARWFGLGLPAFMALAVVVTGNHYFFDAISGAATALLGLWLAEYAERNIYRSRRAPQDEASAVSAASPPV